MTLQEFFDFIATNPVLLVGFFFLVPFTAILAGLLGKGEGHLSPWKYLYSTLIYLSCIPGLFTIMLNVYIFLFERRPILETDIYYQILPILSMVATLLIIKRNVSLDKIPGFGKLSGLLTMIFMVLAIMWILERTRIYAFTYIPFVYVLLMLVGMILIFRICWAKIFGVEN